MYYQPRRRRRCGCLLGLLLLLGAVAVGVWLLFGANIRLPGSDATSTPRPALATRTPGRPNVTRTATPPSRRTPTRVATAVPPAANTPTRAAQEGFCPADCAALRQEMIDLVNRDRERNNLGALALYQPANDAAQAHAEDMLRRDYFAHESPEGDGPGERLERAQAGDARFWAENIYLYTSGRINDVPVPVDDWREMVAEAQEGWMNSEGHRANLLNDLATHLGVGIAYDAASGKTYMVQVFFTPLR